MTDHSSYEVQVQQDGQWTIHETFPGDQREEAINEATKQISELRHLDAVKVIRETLNDETGVFNETVVFKKAQEKPMVRRVPTNLGRRGKTPARQERTAPAKKSNEPQESSLTRVVGILFFIVLFCLSLSGLLAFGISEALSGERLLGVRFVGSAKTNLFIGTFIISFLISVGVSSRIFMKDVKLKKSKQNRLVLWILGMLAQMAKQSAARRAAQEAAARKAMAQRAMANKPAPQPSEQTLAEEPKEEAPAEETAPEETPPATGELSPTAEKLRGYMINFLGKSMEGCQTDLDKLDSFNKFGLSMYMAGACEILSQQGKMDAASQSKILADSVMSLGFKKSHAASFAERYEEYLMSDARYMQMFQSGRNSINIYLTDEGSGGRLLDNALTEWNKPKQREEQTGPITVLFTDIAGSTAMTQTMGDEGAQLVVRAHNRVVREALSNNAGKEIKHTGDGIMASFNKTSDGVDAAIEMQRETAKHNQEHPDLPLHLKIGLNAGEPISEDNDLFGTVVQLSARIVDKASADQIFVSSIIRGICSGKNYKFTNQGGFEMKGFGEEVVLYEVIWDETADAIAEGAESPAPETETPPAESPPA
ncbi:MAG: adenylate/guanylate cyclase domain-containing protein, partial [Proteobacteria bacterium]|nr:adenylate/guanylate cyclase domain-containing protein [Pseudomonadota bacterium]